MKLGICFTNCLTINYLFVLIKDKQCDVIRGPHQPIWASHSIKTDPTCHETTRLVINHNHWYSYEGTSLDILII